MRALINILKSVAGFFFIILIKIYQYFISPLTVATCRYTPTCSQYGVEAIKKHGAFKGGWLTLKRISSCNPWGGTGTILYPETTER